MALGLFPVLTGASGIEWRRVASRREAIGQISANLGAYPLEVLPFDAEALASKPYDMLREKLDIYKPAGTGRSLQCQRRIWVHQEDGPGGIRKISHNTWWVAARSTKSNAKQVTYNTRRIWPMSCWEWPLVEANQTPEHWRGINPLIVEIWEQAVAVFGMAGPPAVKCGWTAAEMQDIYAWLSDKGLRQRSFVIGCASPPGTTDAVKALG
jgi:hypothetical protein